MYKLGSRDPFKEQTQSHLTSWLLCWGHCDFLPTHREALQGFNHFWGGPLAPCASGSGAATCGHWSEHDRQFWKANSRLARYFLLNMAKIAHFWNKAVVNLYKCDRGASIGAPFRNHWNGKMMNFYGAKWRSSQRRMWHEEQEVLHNHTLLRLGQHPAAVDIETAAPAPISFWGCATSRCTEQKKLKNTSSMHHKEQTSTYGRTNIHNGFHSQWANGRVQTVSSRHGLQLSGRTLN